MLTDRYGNTLTTQSETARDAYVEAVDRFLASDIGAGEKFAEAIAADEHFVLASLGAARHYQLSSNTDAVQAVLAKARESAELQKLTTRETSQLEMLGTLIAGDSKTAYLQARKHLLDYPRDAMVAQTCLGVFSLIGFSGLAGREAQHLAIAETLAPHYGDDWWFLGALSFAQTECGQLGQAAINIERSITSNPRSASAAHNRVHLYYESGETDVGCDYLRDWLPDYDKDGVLHGHLYWHLALWELARGNVDAMWEVIDTHIQCGHNTGPAINQLSDMASILYRAEIAGVSVPPERWAVMSQYALEKFANPGLVFVDVHAALAHAMAGNTEALSRIIKDVKGPAAENGRLLAEGFGAIAKQDWTAATGHLVKTMADHERIGGSRAQRDLIEHALVSVLLRSGQAAEAGRLLQMRRPLTDKGHLLVGL